MNKKIKKVIVKLRLIDIFSIPFYIFRLFKIKNNKIVCTNFSGKGYGDSPKYIIEELLNNKNNYDIVWAVKNVNDNNFPKEVRKVKIYSFKYMYELATAKIWINNSRFDSFVRKRKNQFYLQTWHSPLRLKMIELDAIDKMSDYYKLVMKNDSKMIDLMISGCDFSYNIYQNSFLYNGKIVKVGTPRCDIFFDSKKCSDIKEKICDYYHISKNKKIIMYAPTFRVDANLDDYILDYKKMIRQLGNEYILLLRFHPRTNYDISDDTQIINVSKYPDIQDLLCTCDYLITDYSSCCFDMLIANKPCFLFIKDIEQYMKKERNLYFSIDELPFFKTKKVDELVSYFKSFDKIKYQKNVEVFKKKIDLYEKGTASKKIVKIIEGVCNNEKI